MDYLIRLIIPLRARSTGNYRLMGNRFKLYPKTTRKYLARIREYLDLIGWQPILVENECYFVRFVFCFKSKDKGYYYKGKPDLDNLFKGLLDILFEDDSCVVLLSGEKRSGDKDMILIDLGIAGPPQRGRKPRGGISLLM